MKRRGDQGTTWWWKDIWTTTNTSVKFHYTGWLMGILIMSHSDPRVEANPLPCTNQPKRCFFRGSHDNLDLMPCSEGPASRQPLTSPVVTRSLSPCFVPNERKLAQLSQHPWPWRHCQHVPLKSRSCLRFVEMEVSHSHWCYSAFGNHGRLVISQSLI